MNICALDTIDLTRLHRVVGGFSTPAAAACEQWATKNYAQRLRDLVAPSAVPALPDEQLHGRVEELWADSRRRAARCTEGAQKALGAGHKLDELNLGKLGG